MPSLGRLRDIQTPELEQVLAWRNAPSVRQHMYTRHLISLDEHLAWWDRTRQRSDQRYFMYEHHDQPLGVVGFTAIDTTHRNASWAFYASPDAPPGTGSRMELLALDHAFGPLGLHKLHCEVMSTNPGVIRLHQKFGFQVEGVLREHHLYDDRFIDIHRLGLLAPEWQARREDMLAKLNRHPG